MMLLVAVIDIKVTFDKITSEMWSILRCLFF